MNLRAIFDDHAYGTYRRHSGAGTAPYGEGRAWFLVPGSSFNVFAARMALF